MVPTPRLGGIAIFLAFLFSAIVFVPISDTVRGILAGTLVIFATGVMDDLNGISARQKFTGEVIACLVTIGVGKLYLTNLGNLFGFGDIVLPAWLGILFTVFAVVGMINAINLIDGLDGLAGGISIIALTTFLILGALDQESVHRAARVGGDRRGPRFPQVQLLPGAHLHGRHRQPGARLPARLSCRFS